MKTIEQIIEEITNTTTPVSSAGVLVGWFSDLLKEIAGSGAQATSTAAQHAAALEANKESISAAVAANPS
jgi:hypothetical protein